MSHDKGHATEAKRGLLAEWYWQWRLKLAGRRLKEPGCGACGYPVQGLVGTTCPECGADRRAVGVSHPLGPTPRWVGTVAGCGAWVVFVALMATLLNPVLLKGVPRDMSNHRDYSLHPKSKTFDSIEVRRIGYGFGSPWLWQVPEKPRRGWVIARVAGKGLQNFDYELSPGTYSMVASRNGKLDLAALLAILKGWGADTARADVQAEAAELLALIYTPDFSSSPEAKLKQFTLIAPVRGGPEWVPERHGQWLLNVIWVAVVAAGVLFIARWRRQRASVRGFLLDGSVAA